MTTDDAQLDANPADADADHAAPAPTAAGSLTGASSRAPVILACALLVIISFVLDSTSMPNLSILYLLPLLLATRLQSRLLLWGLTVLLSCLTFAGYFLGPHRAVAVSLGAAPVNRIFVVAAMLGMAAWSQVTISHRQGRYPAAQSDEPESTIVYDLMLCAALAGCTFVVDLLTPAQYNLPILYAVPLLICATLRRPVFLWVMLVCLLIFTVIGFLVGPQSSVPQSLIQTVLRNRLLAAGVEVAVAILAQRHLFCQHVWIRSPQSAGNHRLWVCALCRRSMALDEGEIPIP